MKKRIFGRMIKKLKWLVIISVVLVALGNGWNWYCIGIPHEICTEESVQYGVQHGK